MSRRRALSGGMMRMLGDHGADDGRAYRACWAALHDSYGPFPAQSLIRLAAARAAASWATYAAATRRLSEARKARRAGKGRRPSASAVTRLEKREGLAGQTYAQAEAHVRELATARTITPAEQLARANAAIAAGQR